MAKIVSDPLSQLGSSLKGIGKMLLLSRCASKKLKTAKSDDSDSIIIMGNGPSLKQAIAEHADALRKGPAMAVNFAALAPEFESLKPKYYILIDPHFFSGRNLANLKQLWQRLGAVDWPMTLIVAAKMVKKVPAAVVSNRNISIVPVNPVGVEGWAWLERLAYSHAWGMPRPRNVLIAAIMAAAQMGFKDITIVGADHSWMQTISVDDENYVLSVQPHFYADDEKELQRIRADYMGTPLHEVVKSFAIAFEGYHRIQRYALAKGISITNATPGSFIDAFPRRRLN